MASFFLKFVTGGAVAGGLVVYYHDDIARTTDKLSSDLRSLSQSLVNSSPSAQSAVSPLPTGQLVIPQRIPFTEELKARWNEQIGSAFHSLQTTDYADLFSRTYAKLQSSVAAASAPAPASLSSAPVAAAVSPAPSAAQPETTAGKVEERQV
ncbi:hypothetical protein JCM6882_006646 [Rhodosporidiobolus microsporus]